MAQDGGIVYVLHRLIGHLVYGAVHHDGGGIVPRTGGSAAAAIGFMKEYGCTSIKLMVLLAAPEGIERLQKEHPDVEIYCGALDEKLNEKGYIVPGLGDAGDRIFGTK